MTSNEAAAANLELMWNWGKTAADLDHAIDEPRLARVAAAAEILMERFAQPGDDIRVDVLLLAPGALPRHIENAWIG